MKKVMKEHTLVLLPLNERVNDLKYEVWIRLI